MTAIIQKWGNSQGIRLPKHILEAINWNNNDKFDIKTENGKIVIEKISQKERKNIKELFANFDEEYPQVNIDWGEPVGKEIW